MGKTIATWTRQGRLWVHSLEGDLKQSLNLCAQGGAGATPAEGESLWLLGRKDILLRADTRTGTVEKRIPLKGTFRTAPLVTPSGLFLVSEDGLARSLTPEGQVRWEKQIPEGGFISPVLLPGKDPRIILPLKKGALAALDPQTGRTLWTAKTRGVLFAAPAINPKGQLIHQPAMDHCLYTLDREGKTVWSWKGTRWLRATPALFPDGSMALGSYDRHIHCLDVSGHEVRKLACLGPVSPTPSALPDGRITSADSSGTLTSWSPEGRILWQISPPDQDFFRTPLSLSPDQNWGAALRLDGLLILFRTTP